ncbi:BCCT family transporter [Allopusillimonas soli]|uniref:BCCT family transporter n=1 Tax=Allopusillimonas soli TaxID=659016 RepID=A0A853FD02_9BURK|nr:BCCT family transporter [Allopusillimonas soli]NYT36740.1 BCCT family transporter [Allopusillimonas soli]TEA75214.1 BCCT family transporter [Allopusillimonas soli]
MKQPLRGISPLSFYGSAIISIGLIIYASLAPDAAATLFEQANNWIILEAGWFYLLAVGGFVIFLLFLAISPLGKVRLGPDDAVPDYSYSTWVAMLFSAGMGIGIVFYGVAEPIMHFSAPPDAPARSAQAARDALEITFFHWGVHAWAIYAVMGLVLAYFGYRKGEPLVIRSAFRPLIGDKVNGPIGDVIDIFAVVGTLAGLATSLGLGVAQLNATGAYLFGLPQNLETQLILIGIVTILATTTVATGLDNGIRRLSEMIIIVSFVLMFLILALGPTRFLLQALVENIGLYLNGFVARTFHIYAYEPTDWVGTWTLFYWGWWISWSPFVGLFIARISRGRTIRQFLLGVLFAPAGFSFIWFTIFGDVAIWLDLNVAHGSIATTVTENMPIALFTVFEYLPWSTFLAWLTGLLVAVYFVTASDAGALVIAMITSRGEEEPVLWLRIFWALVCGAVAACLLLAGGLGAVQMAAVIAALPLSIVMVLMCYGIWKALNDEVALIASARLQPAPLIPNEAARFWRRRISAIISHPDRRQVDNFIASTVKKAMETVAAELEQPAHIEAHIDNSEEGLRLTINHGDIAAPFVYEVRPVSTPIPAFVLAGPARDGAPRNRYFRAEIFLARGGRGYDIYGYATDQVIADIINHYDKHQYYMALTDSRGKP